MLLKAVRGVYRRVRSLVVPPPPPASPDDKYRPHFSADDLAIIAQVQPYTLTRELRIEALLDAVRYVVKREVPGVFAECGVWLGGSVMAMLLQLRKLGADNRDIVLYDTFEGMTAPTEHDSSGFDGHAQTIWDLSKAAGQRAWDPWFKPEVFNLDKVRELLLSTGYPAQRLHFIKGKVEETLPAQAPDQIALLRLDTDWYESTWHELLHLYPRLSQGGVLLIDDYGHWDGCRKAVDEYFATQARPALLSRVDYTARIAVKV
jgi:hypothetical protein